jgi:hypothetical protein
LPPKKAIVPLQPLQRTLIHSPIFQFGKFEGMVEDVIASIDQLILGEVMCAEAPLSDLCSNVLFALIVHVEVAKYPLGDRAISSTNPSLTDADNPQ